MENSAEQGGGRRKAGALQGRQRSYAKFYTADVKVFYQRIVLVFEVSANSGGLFSFRMILMRISDILKCPKRVIVS